ncbi:hypothetical protein GGR57DRAFT_271805 [Xylariaceae sp. FL1272]|nr:hypothetical protein GGR57DRAFT_271805 [Xylariaceae sp. FL1272]
MFRMLPTMRSSVLLSIILAVSSAVAEVSTRFTRRSGNVSPGGRACTRLSSMFPDNVFWPPSEEFTAQSQALFSETCILSPTCTFEPSSSVMLAEAVKIFKSERSKFSVRSGGHMPVPGAQSVDAGVMVSMSRLNQKTLSKAKTIASLGPGQVWQDVYSWLAQYGLAVNGGRYPTVGVGGVLIGGGIGYFSSTRGWGCDSVVGYEIILADGRIVEAKATGKYSDLFWALHGGHNNFGIVTRFDVSTLPVTSAYIGGAVWDGRGASAQEQFFSALNSYLAPGGGIEDSNVATSPIIALTPSNGTKELISIQFAPGTDPNPQAFENFTKIEAPTIQNLPGVVVPSWTSLLPYLQSFGNRGSRQLFWSVSFATDPRAIEIANHTLVTLADEALSTIPDATVAFTYQPVSKSWLQASKASGHNVMDLNPKDGPFIAGLIACTWTEEADDVAIHAFTKKVASTIERKTKALNLSHPFVYLNDAAPEQKPFETYGAGKSLPKLRSIRNIYDKDNFFRDYMGHGFTLG